MAALKDKSTFKVNIPTPMSAFNPRSDEQGLGLILGQLNATLHHVSATIDSQNQLLKAILKEMRRSKRRR